MLPNPSGAASLPVQRVPGRRSLRHVGLTLVFSLVTALLASGRASASPHSPVVLVLGVQQDGRAVARARSAATQHLLRMGESALAPALSSEDLLCTGNSCLQRLARAYRADRLVGGEILPNDRNYLIRMWMLDVAQQQPSSIEERCIECTPEQVHEKVALGAGKLLDAATVLPPVSPTAAPPVTQDPAVTPDPTTAATTPTAAPTPTAAEQSPTPPEPAVPAPAVAPPPKQPEPAVVPTPQPFFRCSPRYDTFGRGLAVGALSGLTAFGLTAAIGLTASDGATYTTIQDGPVTWNTQTQYRAAYALTAVTAVGLGAALIDWRKLTGHNRSHSVVCESPRSKWTFGRGVALGTFGSLLLSGLVTSVAFTVLHGGTYSAAGAEPVRYDFRSAYATGYAASAALLVGLGLSIGLP